MKKFLSALLVICMIAIMLTGTVSAADPKQAFVRFNGIDYAKNSIIRVDALVNEGETMYFLTNDDGLAYKDGASASNYNLKFEYPKGGTPTLYLKNANLIGQFDAPISVGRAKDDQKGITEIRAFDFILYVEAESTVHSLIKDAAKDITGPSAISLGNKGLATITGPGKLNVTADTNCGIVKGAGDLLIKNANIKSTVLMREAWGTREPIWNNGGGITVENSELDLYSTCGPCIWSSEEWHQRIGEKYDITLKNSKIKCVSDRHSTEFGVIGAMGKIYVDNCDLEVISTGAASNKGIRSFSPKPTLSNVTAIGGKTQEKATTFDEKKNSTTYYFKSTATGGSGSTTPEPTTPAPTTPVGGGNTPTPTTPVGGGNTPTPTTPVGSTPTTPVGGGNNTPTPTTPVGGGDVVDPTTDGVVDPTTDGVVDPTTDGVVDPTTGNDAPTTGNNNGGTSESKPADETTPKADDDTTEEKGSNAVLYIVIAVVAAAAIAAAVFFVIKKKNTTEASE